MALRHFFRKRTVEAAGDWLIRNYFIPVSASITGTAATAGAIAIHGNSAKVPRDVAAAVLADVTNTLVKNWLKPKSPPCSCRDSQEKK